MACMGGLLVFMHGASGDATLSPLLAFNNGATAPLILESMIRQVPEIERGNVDAPD